MCFPWSLLSLWSVRLLLNGEIYFLACPWLGRVEQTRVLFLHLPPFLLEPIAIALLFFPSLVLSLGLVWQWLFNSVVSRKVAISNHFKTKGQPFNMENCCDTEQFTCLPFHPNRPLGCIRDASIVYWKLAVGASSSMLMHSYYAMISQYLVLYIVPRFLAFLLIIQ